MSGGAAPAAPLVARAVAWRSAVPSVAALAGVMVLAVAVRLVRLADDPIWLDEAATLGIARMDWTTIFGPMAAAESSPPGFYALAKLWLGLWGESIVALRLLTVLAGVAVIVPVWLLGRAAGGQRVAWVAALLVALAATHVRFSQDGRVYTMLFLVTALAMLCAVSLVGWAQKDRRARLAAIGLGMSLAAGLWLHATAVFVVVGVNAFVLAGLSLRPEMLRRGLALLLLADLVALVLAAAPLGAMLRHVLTAQAYIDRWIEAPGLLDVVRVYGRTLVAPFLGPLSPWVLLMQLALLGVVAWHWWRTREPLVAAMAAMLAVVAVLVPAVSQFSPVFMDRTVLFLLLPLAVLLAKGVALLPGWPGLAVAAVLLASQAWGVVGWHLVEHRKERWDLVAAVLQERMKPGEKVILTESAFLEISLTAHLRALGAAVPGIYIVPPHSPLERLAAAELMVDRTLSVDEVCDVVAPPASVWLVFRDQPSIVDHDEGFTTRELVRAALRDLGGERLEHHLGVATELDRWHLESC